MLKIKKNANKAWVTFTLEVPEGTGETVEVAGSWSNWKREKMKQKKDGSFSITKILPSENEYEFRYIVDGIWQNEPETACRRNAFGTENSIISI